MSHFTLLFITLLFAEAEPVFSYKLRYIVGFGLVVMAISLEQYSHQLQDIQVFKKKIMVYMW